MNQTQQRIAIAQACGWIKSNRGTAYCHPDNWAMAKNGAESVWKIADELPDYLGNLNAMHNAEEILDSQQINRYGEFLMCAYTGFHDVWTITAYRRSVHATAEHRAKAFLQALGLYESNAKAHLRAQNQSL